MRSRLGLVPLCIFTLSAGYVRSGGGGGGGSSTSTHPSPPFNGSVSNPFGLNGHSVPAIMTSNQAAYARPRAVSSDQYGYDTFSFSDKLTLPVGYDKTTLKGGVLIFTFDARTTLTPPQGQVSPLPSVIPLNSFGMTVYVYDTYSVTSATPSGRSGNVVGPITLIQSGSTPYFLVKQTDGSYAFATQQGTGTYQNFFVTLQGQVTTAQVQGTAQAPGQGIVPILTDAQTLNYADVILNVNTGIAVGNSDLPNGTTLTLTLDSSALNATLSQ